jgi:hypothetical protein
MICAFKLRPISIAAAALLPALSLLPRSDAACACCDAILFLFSWRRDSSCEINHVRQLRACAAACATTTATPATTTTTTTTTKITHLGKLHMTRPELQRSYAPKITPRKRQQNTTPISAISKRDIGNKSFTHDQQLQAPRRAPRHCAPQPGHASGRAKNSFKRRQDVDGSQVGSCFAFVRYRGVTGVGSHVTCELAASHFQSSAAPGGGADERRRRAAAAWATPLLLLLLPARSLFVWLAAATEHP